MERIKNGLLTFLLWILTLPLWAQNGTTSLAGAKGAAIGNASVGLSGIESAYTNQAGLTALKKFSFNLTAENRFLLSELNQFYLAAALPTSSGTFALTIRHFGFSEYNEQKIGLAYARQLFEPLSVGVQFDYLNTRINEFGSKALFTFEAGLQAKILPKLTLGAHVFSPVELALTEEDNLAPILRVGLAYQASTKLLVVAEVEKDLELNPQFKTGLEYQVADELFLRFGAGTNPVFVSFGVGYGFNGFRMDVGSSYHQILGVSPSGSFSMER